MAVPGATAGTKAAASVTASSYRVKFKERVKIAKPRIRYHKDRMYFFAFDGFVMYTVQGKDEDFSQKVIRAIKFSNYQWSEWLHLGEHLLGEYLRLAMEVPSHEPDDEVVNACVTVLPDLVDYFIRGPP